jgi:hypothetical protein
METRAEETKAIHNPGSPINPGMVDVGYAIFIADVAITQSHVQSAVIFGQKIITSVIQILTYLLS